MENPKKYTKKPITVEAIQWTGENLREVIDFTGLHPSAEKWTWEQYEQIVKEDGLKIFTKEGPLKASEYDYIVKGYSSELGSHFCPVKPDYFEENYSEEILPAPTIEGKPDFEKGEAFEMHRLIMLINHLDQQGITAKWNGQFWETLKQQTETTMKLPTLKEHNQARYKQKNEPVKNNAGVLCECGKEMSYVDWSFVTLSDPPMTEVICECGKKGLKVL